MSHPKTVLCTDRINAELIIQEMCIYGMIWFNVNIQRCKGPFTPSVGVNAAMMLAILLSLKTMESPQNEVANPFSSDSIVFNENSIASLIAELSQH